MVSSSDITAVAMKAPQIPLRFLPVAWATRACRHAEASVRGFRIGEIFMLSLLLLGTKLRKNGETPKLLFIFFLAATSF
jgi:hypothetical protein